MPEDYLPPVVAQFKADIADFLAKIEAAKLALRDFRDQGVSAFGDVRDAGAAAGRDMSDGARRSANDAGNAVRDGLGRGGRDGGQELRQGVREGLDNTVRDSQRAGDDAGRSFMDSLRRRISSDGGGSQNPFSGALPGGRSAADPAFLTALTASAGIPLAAGLMEPLTAGVAGLLPGALGIGAALPVFLEQMKEVTKAASDLENQTQKYNAAADKTATYLNTDTAAMGRFRQLLGEVTQPQREVLNLLNQQNVSWGDLTDAQQAAVIQLRDTKQLWDALAPSQKEEINALIAQHDALAKLHPEQQAAVEGYAKMKDAFDGLKASTAPQMFQAIAAGEKLVTDALPVLAPLINATSDAFRILFERMDQGVQSGAFQHFVDAMAGRATNSIVEFGTALGHFTAGVGHMFEVIIESGAGDRFLSWMSGLAQHFDQWSQSSQGADKINRFMATVEQEWPNALALIGELSHLVGVLWSAFASDPLALKGIETILNFLGWVGSTAMGQTLLNLGALALVLERVAKALGLIKLAESAVSVIGRIGGSAESAAAGAAGAATAAEGAAARGGAAAAAGGAASAAGLAGASSAALTGLGAALALGVAGFVTVVNNASQKTKEAYAKAGVEQANSNGMLRAAVDQSSSDTEREFRTLAQRVTSSDPRDALKAAGTNYAAAMDGYQASIRTHNANLKDVLALGSSEFGQTATLFVDRWGGDVNAMATEVKTSGQDFATKTKGAMAQSFQDIIAEQPGYWQKFQDTSKAESAKAFQALQDKSKEDYTSVGDLMRKLEDDLKNGRQKQADQDSNELMVAMQKFMADANNGVIDTSNTQIHQLGKDIEKYLTDMTKGDSSAADLDLKNMFNDISGSFKANTQDMQGAAKSALDSVMAAFKAQINSGGSGVFSLGAGNLVPGAAEGGLIPGQSPHPKADDKLYWLTSKEYVMPVEQTAKYLPQLEAMRQGTFPGMADGGLVGDVYNMGLGNAEVLMIRTAQAFQAQAAQELEKAIGGVVPDGLHKTIIDAALKAAGVPPPGTVEVWEAGLNTLINRESSWNAGAINLTDSNAAAGTPSKGLAQVIDPTFAAYHVPGLDNILAPVDNVAAAIRYIVATYGNITNVQQANANLPPQGYDWGGIWPHGTTGVNLSGRPEVVFTDAQWAILRGAVQRGAGGHDGGEQHIHVHLDGREIYHEVRRAGWQAERRNGRGLYATQRG